MNPHRLSLLERDLEDYSKDFLSNCKPGKVKEISKDLITSFLEDYNKKKLKKIIVNSVIGSALYGASYLIDYPQDSLIPTLTAIGAGWTLASAFINTRSRNLAKNAGSFLKDAAKQMVRKYYLVDQYKNS